MSSKIANAIFAFTLGLLGGVWLAHLLARFA